MEKTNRNLILRNVKITNQPTQLPHPQGRRAAPGWAKGKAREADARCCFPGKMRAAPCPLLREAGEQDRPGSVKRCLLFSSRFQKAGLYPSQVDKRFMKVDSLLSDWAAWDQARAMHVLWELKQ